MLFSFGGGETPAGPRRPGRVGKARHCYASVMRYDQGHITAKLLAPQWTAGVTIGTPVLSSSVACGTAHDIAGKNRVKPDALIEAIRRLVGVAFNN